MSEKHKKHITATFQAAVEGLLEELLCKEKIVARLLEEQFDNRKIKLEKRQIEKIADQIVNCDEDFVDISFEDSGILFEEAQSLDDIQELIQESLNSISFEIRNEAIDFFRARKLSNEILKLVCNNLIDQLRQETPSIINKRSSDKKVFEKKLMSLWLKPLFSLELMLHLSLEIGHEFDREFKLALEGERDYVFEVLTHFHAQACQVFSEILSLLKTGHAQGAYARCRSLHETVVLSRFIAKSDSDIAERFILHDKVRAYKAAEQYEKYRESIGGIPISRNDYRKIRQDYDDLLKRFGKSFKRNYGWAIPALDNKGNPSFADIEEKIGLSHLHPFYKMASHYVHARPFPLLFKIGDRFLYDDVCFAGPSLTGLSYPGPEAALHLAKVTSTFLSIRYSTSRCVAGIILHTLANEISRDFLEVEALLRKKMTVE